MIRSIKKSEDDIPVPPLLKSAALWGMPNLLFTFFFSLAVNLVLESSFTLSDHICNDLFVLAKWCFLRVPPCYEFMSSCKMWLFAFSFICLCFRLCPIMYDISFNDMSRKMVPICGGDLILRYFPDQLNLQQGIDILYISQAEATTITIIFGRIEDSMHIVLNAK